MAKLIFISILCFTEFPFVMSYSLNILNTYEPESTGTFLVGALQYVACSYWPFPLLQPVSIGDVVSERLSAIRNLKTNPYDVQALTKMHRADRQVGILSRK